jgi:predicted small secreted protein
MANNVPGKSERIGLGQLLGGDMNRTKTAIACALLSLTLTACGTIGGASRGVGEVASGVGEDFTSVGEWIGNF